MQRIWTEENCSDAAADFYPAALCQQWRSQPKSCLGEPKCLTLGEQQYYWLGCRFSKHKMTRYVKNVLGAWPPGPSLGYTYVCEFS